MKRRNPIVILLAEDDPAHAEIVQRNLEPFRAESRLYHVPDGQAALDFLLRQGAYRDPEKSPRPAVVLLDLRLPKVDGLDVLSRIKADDGLKSIPTVVLTTSAANSDIVNAYANGAGSYLVKPTDFDGFRRLLLAFGRYWLTWNRYPFERSAEGP